MLGRDWCRHLFSRRSSRHRGCDSPSLVFTVPFRFVRSVWLAPEGSSKPGRGRVSTDYARTVDDPPILQVDRVQLKAVTMRWRCQEGGRHLGSEQTETKKTDKGPHSESFSFSAFAIATRYFLPPSIENNGKLLERVKTPEEDGREPSFHAKYAARRGYRRRFWPRGVDRWIETSFHE